MSPPPTKTVTQGAIPPAVVLDGQPSDAHPDCGRCPARCCHGLDVHVTALDIVRITAATGRTAVGFVRLAPTPRSTPDSLLLDGDGPEFELLLQRDGACVFLEVIDDEGRARCRIYEHRPAVCRAYPFYPRGDEKLALLTIDADALCPPPLLEDARIPNEALLPGLLDKEAERRAHRGLVDRWNRQVAAADAGGPAKTLPDLLAWLLAEAD